MDYKWTVDIWLGFIKFVVIVNIYEFIYDSMRKLKQSMLFDF